MTAGPLIEVMGPPEEPTRRALGARRLAREFFSNGGAVIGVVALTVVVLGAIFAPVLSPSPPTEISLSDRLAPPAWAGGTWDHPLGTDQLGRDVLARLLDGARVSLLTGTLVVIITTVVGTALGLIAGYFGGWRDTVAMRMVDAWIAFPGLLLAIAVVTMVGAGMWTIVVILSVIGWMRFTRVTRDIVLGLKETSFVKAAETSGTRPARIIARHLLPNLASPVLTLATLEFAIVVLAEAGLSYLGFGIQPPESSWGLMVAEGQAYLTDNGWLVVLPGIAIAVVVLSLNLIASWIRIVSDPRQRDRQLRRGRSRDAGGAAQQVDQAAVDPKTPLVTVAGLDVDFARPNGGSVAAVRDVSLDVRRGETLGIVGESGSGKSVTMRAMMGLIEPPGEVTGGDVHWRLEPRAGQRAPVIVGDRATMVFQDPGASLNPLVPVGRQITEVLRKHKGMSRRQADARALELLELVGIPSPERRLRQYPFELSGGMAQRVALTIALAPEPDLIIADEPTTALDVTIQAQILKVLRDIQAQFGMSMILIAHDLGVVAGMCDRIAVMYAGRLVELGDAEQIFGAPQHPYTAALIASTPRLDRSRTGRLVSIPGTLPGLGAAMSSCAFAPRCTRATDRCHEERPPLETGAQDRVLACWHPLGVNASEPEVERSA